MITVKEFLESKPLTMNRDMYGGYQITYSYLVLLLEEYTQMKINELKSDVIKSVCECGDDYLRTKGTDGNYYCTRCGNKV